MYREVFRVLKPGARFGTYEWCMTEQFDPENADHAATRRGIIEGNGLPELQAARDAVAAMQAAGFVVEAQLDRGGTGDIPWYDPFFPHRWEWATFRSSGRHPRATERSRAKGTGVVARYLDVCATDLLAGARWHLHAGLFHSGTEATGLRCAKCRSVALSTGTGAP